VVAAEVSSGRRRLEMRTVRRQGVPPASLCASESLPCSPTQNIAFDMSRKHLNSLMPDVLALIVAEILYRALAQQCIV